MKQAVPQEELESYVGKHLGYSEWMVVDQDRVNAFADVTLDHQYIHVDPEAAAQTPFGGTIAHGFLTLSLLVHLTADLTVAPERTLMSINYGFDKVRFLAPVRVGKAIRAGVEVREIAAKGPGRYLMTYGVTVEIEGEDKPALVADWLGMAVTG